jgi:hypothetical protein
VAGPPSSAVSVAIDLAATSVPTHAVPENETAPACGKLGPRTFFRFVVKAHELRVPLRYDGAPSSAVDPGAGEGRPVANR